MTTPYKNHVFQRATFPWMVLTNLGLAIAIASGIAAFWIAKSWVDQGRYLQSIETEQIEALRLAPLLKDLKSQVGGPFALDPSFFAALKKADKALKLTADELPSPSAVNNVAGTTISPTALSKSDKSAQKTAKTDKPAKVDLDKEAAASLKPVLGSKLKGSNKEVSTPSESIADKSSNPIVKFFKKIDSKVSQIFFGKKDELADEDVTDNADQKEASSSAPEATPVQVSAQDFLANAKLVDKAVSNILFQERSLAGLTILAKSADTLLAPKAPFELDKLAEDAPGRKFAESLTQFNKANSAWQKNITDNAASEDLLKVMGELIDQKVLLEIAAGKKSANKPEAKFTEAMTKLHQSAWHTKLPQETVIALKQFSSSIQTIRELASAPESYADLLQKNGSLLKVSDTSIKSGFLFYMLVSAGASILALLSSMLLIRAYRLNTADLMLAQRRKPDATDKLLSSIDLGFAMPETVKPSKLESAPMAPLTPIAPTFAAPIAPTMSSKADAARLSDNDQEHLQVEFMKKIAAIESNFRALGQMGLKLRQSIIGVHSKASELHNDRLESNSARAKASASAAAASGKDNAGPVDQLLEAFFAVKQQGVRLYLSILDNHSSRQLAMETEDLNSLVERVETTVLQIRGTLSTMLEGAEKVSNAQEANQITNSQFADIEMMELDANQALRDLEQWQSEFDKLGNSLTAAQR